MAGNANSGRIGKKKADGKDTEVNVMFTKPMPARVKKFPAARDLWDDIVKELNGIIQDKDAYALETMAMLRAEIVKLENKLLRNGHTYTHVSDRGQKNQTKRPEVDMLRTVRSEYAKMLIQFGLTPRSGKQVRNPGKPGRPPSRGSIKDKY